MTPTATLTTTQTTTADNDDSNDNEADDDNAINDDADNDADKDASLADWPCLNFEWDNYNNKNQQLQYHDHLFQFSNKKTLFKQKGGLFRGKNVNVVFQFEKPPGGLFGRIRYIYDF